MDGINIVQTFSTLYLIVSDEMRDVVDNRKDGFCIQPSSNMSFDLHIACSGEEVQTGCSVAYCTPWNA